MATAKFIPLDRIVAGENISIATGNAQLTISSSGGGGGSSFETNVATLANDTFKTLAVVTFNASYGAVALMYNGWFRATSGSTTIYRTNTGFMDWVWQENVPSSALFGVSFGHNQSGSSGSGSISPAGVATSLGSNAMSLRFKLNWSVAGQIKEMHLSWSFIKKLNAM